MINISINSGFSYENNYNPDNSKRNNTFLNNIYGISLDWGYYDTVKNNNCMSSNIFFELSQLKKISPQEPQEPQEPQSSVDNNSTQNKKWWQIFGGRNKTKKRKSRKVKRSRKVRKSKKVKRSRKSI